MLLHKTYMTLVRILYTTYVTILVEIQSNSMCGVTNSICVVILMRCFSKVCDACDTIPKFNVDIGTTTSP